MVHGPNAYGKGWNDADQLVIGNPNITLNHAQSQMAMWSILATPLIMSADLRKIKAEFADILMNRNLIAINQDALGVMGKRILIASSNVDVWHKPLIKNYDAFVLFNNLKSYTPVYIELSLKSLQLTKYQSYLFYESFTGNLIGKFDQSVNKTLKIYVNSYYNMIAFWTKPEENNAQLEPKNHVNLWEEISPAKTFKLKSKISELKDKKIKNKNKNKKIKKAKNNRTKKLKFSDLIDKLN